MGQHTTYTQAVGDEICERIANGETVRQICLLEGMPNQSTVYRWLRAHEDFREQYARAKADQADHFAEELLDIADDSRNDWEERESNRTGQTYIALNEEAIARAKLRIETRKWLMGKMKPKKYGDRTILAGDPDAPLAGWTDAQVEERFAKLAGKAGIAAAGGRDGAPEAAE